VFRFDENLKVYLHRDPVDFRYGMVSSGCLAGSPPSAALHCLDEMQPDEFAGGRQAPAQPPYHL
jgi:hypothetical protein